MEDIIKEQDWTKIMELLDIFETTTDEKIRSHTENQVCKLIVENTQPGMSFPVFFPTTVIYADQGRMYLASPKRGESPHLQRVTSEREVPSSTRLGICDGIVYHKGQALICRSYNLNPWTHPDAELKTNRFLIEFKAVPRGARRYQVNHQECMNEEEKRRIVGTFDCHLTSGYTPESGYQELVPFIFETRVFPNEPIIGLETTIIEQILSLFQGASEGNIEALVRGEWIPREPAVESGIYFPKGTIMVHGINILGNYLKWAHDEKKIYGEKR